MKRTICGVSKRHFRRLVVKELQNNNPVTSTEIAEDVTIIEPVNKRYKLNTNFKAAPLNACEAYEDNDKENIGCILELKNMYLLVFNFLFFTAENQLTRRLIYLTDTCNRLGNSKF